MQPWWAMLSRSTICHNNKCHDANLDDDHEYDNDDIDFDDDMYLAGFI